MSLRGIKLITFDATNTLLKFRIPPWKYYAIVAQDHGYNICDADLKTRLLNSFKIMWTKYPNFGRDSIKWEDWWRQVVKFTFEGCLPLNADVDVIANKLIQEFKTLKCWYKAEGGDRLLSYIHDNKISIGVISNFDPRLHDILQNMSMHKDFEFVLTSYETGYSKPDTRIFKHALENSGNTKPHESLHIGDDVEKDYKSARLAGWHALLVTKQSNFEIPLADKHVFKNLDHLYYSIIENRLVL